ncbi:MAG: serine/threonine-protein kinase [Pyrinomonadaceae bacterium]
MKPLAQNTLIQNRYLIVHLIGKGGMGEVYLAVDQRLGSAVALKRTFFAGDAMLGNAFEREARTLARMRHPVLPKVSDHFGENEEQYLVMEHISGDDLAKRLEIAQKPFPVSWVLFWADQLLDALSYLHTHEPPIIHRDIKPQNLKLTDENHIILLDFGLSKTSTGQTNVSQSGSTGSVVGYTPHYAPMEQIRGIGTSARSDIYSLSATLYQLMTNMVPADALSRADSMLNEMPDPIEPPFTINPEIPKSVSDVILKGMEVSQERRYADAREMQKVLRKAFNEMQQATMAKTVAFNVSDDKSGAIDQPVAGLAVENPANVSQTGKTSLDPEVSSILKTGASDGGNDGQADLDATMGYDPTPATGSIKQADVKTEVFLAGRGSLPLPEKQSYESDVPAPSSAPADDYSDVNEYPSGGSSAEPAGYTPDATAPFISLGGEANDSIQESSADSSSYAESGEGAFATSASVPYFETPQSTEDDRPEPAPYVNKPPVAVAKKSSSKALAVVGGLVALLFLGAVVAGGIWAYINFAPAQIDTDPTPSPERTEEETPSPEPTLDTIFNSNSSDSPDPGNSNSDTNVNSNTNDNGLTVPPTPDPTPVTSSTRTIRPTPQPIPRVTPVIRVLPPKGGPTLRKPVTTPTVRQ